MHWPKSPTRPSTSKPPKDIIHGSSRRDKHDVASTICLGVLRIPTMGSVPSAPQVWCINVGGLRRRRTFPGRRGRLLTLTLKHTLVSNLSVTDARPSRKVAQSARSRCWPCISCQSVLPRPASLRACQGTWPDGPMAWEEGLTP